MTEFETTPWTNGKPNHGTGSGFGLNIPKRIRDSLFQSDWTEVEIVVGGRSIMAPLSPAFWRKCNEIRSAEIGKWLIEMGLDTWPKGHPPRIKMSYLGSRQFRLGEA